MSIVECVRCSATKTNGGRCTRTTCIYPGLCWQHFRAKNGLKLAPSQILNSGLGLFTTRPVQPYRKIADYTGEIWNDADWANSPSDYGIQYDEDHTLDARSTQDGIARYANECRAENRQAGQCRGNNAQLRRTRQNSLILESRGSRIPANREIFTAYGDRYWDG